MKTRKQPAAAKDSVYAEARKLREKNAPAALAQWKPERRRRTVDQLLQASLKDRLPELTEVRWERMAASPFGFFRGSACVMAYDLSLGVSTGIEAQLCGDAHVQNLGAFEGDDGRLIFDINDFDETARGPFEWDVKRMATSILLAAHDAKLKSREANEAAGNFLGTYTGMMKRLVKMPVLAVARSQVHRLGAVAPISKILQKAERATALGTLDKLTVEYPKARIFRSNPPLLRRVEGAERDAVLGSLKGYEDSLQPERRHFFSRFKPLDVGFKVVGTGSVGLRAYVVYMEGNGPGDPLFLQIKQEVASCYAPYLKHTRKAHNGRRVVEGQRAMQLQSDPLLGWTRVGAYDFLVRQLNDHKASIDLTTVKLRDLAQYAEVCAEMLARGHARSGDVRAIAGYLGSGGQFGRAVLDFAEAYAEQAATDWKAFTREHPLKKAAGGKRPHAA